MPSDLDSFRELFPQAVGVELLVSGFVIVLFSCISDVKDAYCKVWPLELAGLRVFFDVAHYEYTTAPIESGIGLSTDPSGEHHSRVGCLGLKLRLQDGSSAITTVTHDFVRAPETSKLSQIITRFHGLYERVKLALMRYVNERDASSSVLSQEQSTNSPIGREVWLASSNKRIGTITQTYDHPSATVPYPSGYLHDLSLIFDPDLPDVTNPPGYPLVTGWADYHAALEQQDVYVVCHHTSVERWQCIDREVDGTLFKKATVLGTGYTWNKLDRTQNSFILWHTGRLPTPAGGWSGSPLCLGRPSEAASKAAVFQNFQRMCLIGGDIHSSKETRVPIKAQFVLPPDIRGSAILGGE